jgi:hypothetical protein
MEGSFWSFLLSHVWRILFDKDYAVNIEFFEKFLPKSNLQKSAFKLLLRLQKPPAVSSSGLHKPFPAMKRQNPPSRTLEGKNIDPREIYPKIGFSQVVLYLLPPISVVALLPPDKGGKGCATRHKPIGIRGAMYV